jgi:hypothetical protein
MAPAGDSDLAGSSRPAVHSPAGVGLAAPVQSGAGAPAQLSGPVTVSESMGDQPLNGARPSKSMSNESLLHLTHQLVTVLCRCPSQQGASLEILLSGRPSRTFVSPHPQ